MIKLRSRYDDKVVSVTKALTILEELSKEPNGLGIIELSNRVKMHKTTVYRLLTSLMEKDFVEQDGINGKYSLGMKILILSNALFEKMDIRVVIRQYVTEFRQRFNGTILVSKELDGEYIVMDCIDSDASFKLNLGENVTKSNCIKKTFLANASLWQGGNYGRMDQIFKDEDIFSRKELKNIVLQGYNFSKNDIEGLPCVSFPVFNFSKSIVCVLSLHSQDLLNERVQSEIVLQMLDITDRISNNLGFVNYI